MTSQKDPARYVGMLGGGQLGRMFAQAAHSFGYRTVSLVPEDQPIIADVAQNITAEYTDTAALDKLIAAIGDAPVTLEFENIPVETLEYLESKSVTLRPGIRSLKIAQDRRLEKTFFREEAQVPTAPFFILEKDDDLKNEQLVSFSFPAILKTARDGYDGKGQVKVSSLDELASAWESLRKVPAILESFVTFDRELSILVVRGADGDIAFYGPFHNEHEDHILATTWSGMPIADATVESAYELGQSVVEQLDYVGVLCIELFQCGDELVVNEMAPRPHNSGHLTIETYTASQFEQQARAALGLPLAPAVMRSPGAMINIVGFRPSESALQQIMALPGVHWHWYAKDAIKEGRKLGHITLEASTFEKLEELYVEVKGLLKP